MRDEANPLLRAIADVRDELERLIAEQEGHLRALGPEAPAPPRDDPRRRLDALARHLDDRLRQASSG
jgi:hypothetical protein